MTARTGDTIRVSTNRGPQVRQHQRAADGHPGTTQGAATVDTTNPTPTQTTELTRVVHVKDAVPGAVYIGRSMPRQGLKASPFANPFKIGRDGDRNAVLSKYWFWITQDNRALLRELPNLRGKPLACWCRHDDETLYPWGDSPKNNRCHGDVLIRLLDMFTDEQFRSMQP